MERELEDLEAVLDEAGGDAFVWGPSSGAAPTLVMDGGKSSAWIRHANRSLANVLPNAQYRTLEGQTHVVKGKAHVPVLVEFFKS